MSLRSMRGEQLAALSTEFRYVLQHCFAPTQTGQVYNQKLVTVMSVVYTPDGNVSLVMCSVSDTLYFYERGGKAPVKTLQFTNTSLPLCIAHAPVPAVDGIDLLIGFSSGEVTCASVKALLADSSSTKLTGVSYSSRDASGAPPKCTAVVWVPKSEGLLFLAAHADGNVFLYDRIGGAGHTDTVFCAPKSEASFLAAQSRAVRSSGGIRWPVCSSAITALAFSPSGSTLAVAARDGVLRLVDYPKGSLAGGWKSYFGAFLSCAWSPDGKFVIAGGESDCVEVWSIEARAVVARAEGHCSWVSAVAFDPHLPAAAAAAAQGGDASGSGAAPQASPSMRGEPARQGRGDESGSGAGAGPGAPPLMTHSGAPSAVGPPPVSYRFASVGQDAAVALWDLQLDDSEAPDGDGGGGGGGGALLPGPGRSSFPGAGAQQPPGSPGPPASPSNVVFTMSTTPAKSASTHQRSVSVGGLGNSWGSTTSLAHMGSQILVRRDDAGGAGGPPAGGAAPNAIAQPPGRSEVARLAPAVLLTVHSEPCVGLAFMKDAVLTACYAGLVKVWARPKPE